MADVLIGSVLELLRSIVEQEVNLVYGVKKSVRKLTSNFQAIRAVIADAERKQMEDPCVKLWLNKLKVVSYKIEDVLDEWNTAILKAKIHGVKKKQSITVRLFKPARKIGLRRDIAVKINDLNDELDVIADERSKYSFQSAAESSNFKSEQRMTSSVIDVLDVVGRVDDKERLINMLSSGDGPNLGIISVIGMGGIGKTTLAQFAYNDQSIHFDKRMWVCVSDPFDEIRVAKAILEFFTGSTPNLNELDPLLQLISEYVRGKKILLVLDDVWCQKYDWCQKLQDSLKAGCLPGSKILVTTRNEGVANAVCSENFSLGVLLDSESQDLFRRVTFRNWTDKERENVEDIADEIVKKCNGLPLAVKTMGGFLRMKKPRREWSSVLESDLWRVAEERDVFPPLLLSYNELSPALRMCFLYCAVFPKDYPIKRCDIINLWMAQGYLIAENNIEMEAVGDEYFSELAMRSFLQDFEKHDDGTIKHCKMHDIVHDFAQYLSKKECLAMEVNDSELETSSYDSTRHLMIIFRRSAVSIPISLGSLEGLRTLKIKGFLGAINNNSFYEAFGEVIGQLTSLRTLDLSETKIEKIPREVGKLIHLRYLNLEYCDMLKELPETVWDLCNLLILNVCHCRQLKRLPHGLGKVINLRQLVLDCSEIHILPRGVDKLMFLQHLDRFPVSREISDKNDASSLFDLMNLNKLRGKLEIIGLGNVTEVSETRKASLHEKKHLTELCLTFNSDFIGEEEEERRSRDVEVLEALQPHPNLQTLEIWDYKGIMAWPSWMMSSMTYLKHLDLHYCTECEVLPSLGKLPSLEILVIFRMDSVKRVGVEFLGTLKSSANSPTVCFPKLEMLSFRYMNEWEEWDDISITSTTISRMPRLQVLNISNCKKLKTVPDHILNKPSLHTFNIDHCPILKERLIQYFQRPTHPDWVVFPRK